MELVKECVGTQCRGLYHHTIVVRLRQTNGTARPRPGMTRMGKRIVALVESLNSHYCKSRRLSYISGRHPQTVAADSFSAQKC